MKRRHSNPARQQVEGAGGLEAALRLVRNTEDWQWAWGQLMRK
jgi:hypothetical protein